MRYVILVLALFLIIARAGAEFDQFIAPEGVFSARSGLVIGGILTLFTLLLWFTRLQM